MASLDNLLRPIQKRSNNREPAEWRVGGGKKLSVSDGLEEAQESPLLGPSPPCPTTQNHVSISQNEELR